MVLNKIRLLTRTGAFFRIFSATFRTDFRCGSQIRTRILSDAVRKWNRQWKGIGSRQNQKT